MALMSRVLAIILLCFLPAAAQDYWHRVSGTFGGFIPASGIDTEGFDSAPVLSFDYGYRFHRHGQFDAGADAAFASRDSARTNIYMPRVGYSAIIPLRQDRIEVILGGGGAYAFYKPRVTDELWMIYAQAGANYALDVDRRYRAGLMLRWYRDLVGVPSQQWVSVGAQITYSFGR